MADPFKWQREPAELDTLCCPTRTRKMGTENGTVHINGGEWLLESDGYHQTIVEHECVISGRIDSQSFRRLIFQTEMENQEEYLERCMGGSCRQGFKEQPVLIVSHEYYNTYALAITHHNVSSECHFII